MLNEREAAEAEVIAYITQFPEEARQLLVEIEDCGTFHGGPGYPFQRALDAVRALVARGEMPMFPTVVAELLRTGHEKSIAGYSVAAGRQTAGCIVEQCLRTLRRTHARQRVDDALGASQAKLRAGADAAEVAQELRAIVSSAPTQTGLHEGIDSVIERVVERLHEVQEGRGIPPQIPSMFGDLNHLIGGYRRQHWTVVAARPKHGKSSLAEQEAVWHARKGRPVLHCSLEMSSDDHAERIIIRESECQMSTRDLWTDGNKGPGIRRRVDGSSRFFYASQELATLPIRFAPCSRRRNISSVIASLERACAWMQSRLGQGPELVVLDYMQKIQGPKMQRLDQALAEASLALCEWIQGTEAAGILVAQLNRALEKEKREPRASDLRECGQLEQDAAAVTFIHRPNRRDDGNDQSNEECSLIVSESRFGMTGRVPLTWRGPLLRFDAEAKEVPDTWAF